MWVENRRNDHLIHLIRNADKVKDAKSYVYSFESDTLRWNLKRLKRERDMDRRFSRTVDTEALTRIDSKYSSSKFRVI